MGYFGQILGEFEIPERGGAVDLCQPRGDSVSIKRWIPGED